MKSLKIKVESARGHTDFSLGQERAKTDLLLQRAPAEAEMATDVALQESRQQADAALRQARKESDLSMRTGSSARFSTASAEPLASARRCQCSQRAAMDGVVSGERHRVDAALSLERAERDVVEPMATERANTDVGLRLERDKADDVSEFAGASLLDEQAAHALARLALQQRDGFIALVTHELRNPLTTILLSAELLALQAPPGAVGESTRRLADDIKTASAGMTGLIGDLMDVARMQTGRLGVTLALGDVVPVLQDAARAGAPVLTKRGLALSVLLPPGPQQATFDASRVRQVLANLIDNAAKFTPAGGTVTVGLERVDQAIRCFVRDTGVGIPAQDAAHVFEQFWQLGKNDRRGLGLGLYICKGIVESHGGQIWFEACAAGGTAFYFTLPIDV